MGLKDLNSNLDLVGGNDPVGNMGGQQGPQFQLSTTDASQKITYFRSKFINYFAIGNLKAPMLYFGLISIR